MRVLLAVGMTAVAASIGAALAQTTPALPAIRWGLWENRMTGLPGWDDQAYVTRSCVAASTWKGFMDSHGDDDYVCEWTHKVAEGKTFSADASCKGGKLTGHAEMVVDSPESYHYRMSMKSVEDAAHPMQFEIVDTSKFVGTSCAGLQPGEEIDVWE
jgi:hypothetical protein